MKVPDDMEKELQKAAKGFLKAREKYIKCIKDEKAAAADMEKLTKEITKCKNDSVKAKLQRKRTMAMDAQNKASSDKFKLRDKLKEPEDVLHKEIRLARNFYESVYCDGIMHCKPEDVVKVLQKQGYNVLSCSPIEASRTENQLGTILKLNSRDVRKKLLTVGQVEVDEAVNDVDGLIKFHRRVGQMPGNASKVIGLLKAVKQLYFQDQDY